MSLNDVKLDQELVAGLYGNNLVQVPSDNKVFEDADRLSNYKSPKKSPESSVSPEKSPEKIKFLGKNLQQIVILVNNPDEVFLGDEELNLLTKMLTACKLTLGDVAIINFAKTPVQQEKIHTQFHPSRIIMLGVESKDISLPMNFPEYRVQPHGPCSYLIAPGLSSMTGENETSRAVKTQLWTALKQLFGL